MKAMTKLCIFDLDGTVLYTVPTIAHYGNLALRKNGIEAIAEEQYKYLAGNGIAALVRGMLKYRGCSGEETYARVYRDYDEAYNADVTRKTRIFEGLKETLDEMKARGIALAIVSNKPDFAARSVVEAFYGKDYFFFVTGQTPGGPLKPDPAVVLSVVERADVSRQDCLYVGDTSTDMKTGKNAGIFTIGVLWGFRDATELLENGADALATAPRDLLTFLQ